jgi:site-specific DNA recombinase
MGGSASKTAFGKYIGSTRTVHLWYMAKQTSKIKYFEYARKSSEGEDRQVQSIDRQHEENHKTISRYSLEVIDSFSESRSAKMPNNRPAFSEMIRRIEKGEANGIVCWHLNRLSRNPLESGILQQLLADGKIQSIQTKEKEYLPSDNAIIISVESGMSSQFSKDLAKAVKSGIDKKIVKGLAPVLAPLGYLNTKHEIRGENYIIKDPERFDLIKKAWQMMLTGEYTIPKLLKIMNDDWGIRTRTTRHRGGGKINKSTMYNMLTNIFYTGLFIYNGEIGNGKHESMITMDEFDIVQKMLGRYGKPRAKSHIFSYTGTMICGECGSAVTACTKTKLIKTKNELRDYTFYYCSHRKKGSENCSQKTYIPLADVEDMIKEELSKYTISEKFRNWALRILEEEHSEETKERELIYKTQLGDIEASQRELDNLITMRMRDLINDEQYASRKNELTEKIVVLKQKINETENRAVNWLQYTEQVFDFAQVAKSKFEDTNTTLDEKKSIFTALGWNYIVKDKKLFISPNDWLEPIEKKRKAVESEINRLELEKTFDIKEQNTRLGVLCPILRSRRDLNPQPPT